MLDTAERERGETIGQEVGRPEHLLLLGDRLRKCGRIRKAIEKYQKAIRLSPGFATAHFKLGICLSDDGQYRKSIEHYQKAIRFQPQAPEPYINLGNLYARLKQPSRSISCYRKAISLRPLDAELYFYLGCALRESDELSQSIAATNKALEIDPFHKKARFSLALSYLLSGDFHKGWRAYDSRLEIDGWQEKYTYLGDRPLWKGEPFTGKKLLIQSEQGFGDTLQFVRFLPMVKKLGGHIIFETEKPLFNLLKGFEGVDQLRHNRSDPLGSEAFDLYIPLLSLPGRLGIRMDSIPADTPYLFASEKEKKHWRGCIDQNQLNVGLVWAGNPKHSKNEERSCSLETFERFSLIPGIKLYSLQKEVTENDRLLARMLRMRLLGESFTDFAATAGGIHQMDVIISVDTSVAHLAGAMGKPTCLLLPTVADFRWMTHRSDSPWYPTMRIYRQKIRGDWDGVLLPVCEALSNMALKMKGQKNKVQN